jgi:hypothetical protein
MERKMLVIKLRTLREEIEEDGISTLDVVAPVGLILGDVCDVLELCPAERYFVLGEETAQAVEEWSTARMWQPAERETATQPLGEMAAVPVA